MLALQWHLIKLNKSFWETKTSSHHLWYVTFLNLLSPIYKWIIAYVLVSLSYLPQFLTGLQIQTEFEKILCESSSEALKFKVEGKSKWGRPWKTCYVQRYVEEDIGGIWFDEGLRLYSRRVGKWSEVEHVGNGLNLVTINPNWTTTNKQPNMVKIVTTRSHLYYSPKLMPPGIYV